MGLLHPFICLSLCLVIPPNRNSPSVPYCYSPAEHARRCFWVIAYRFSLHLCPLQLCYVYLFTRDPQTTKLLFNRKENWMKIIAFVERRDRNERWFGMARWITTDAWSWCDWTQFQSSFLSKTSLRDGNFYNLLLSWAAENRWSRMGWTRECIELCAEEKGDNDIGNPELPCCIHV